MVVLEGVPAVAVLLGLVLMLALAYAYDNTLGALFQAVGNWFRGVSLSIPVIHKGVSLGFIASALDGLDNHIRQYLATAIRNLEYAWHKLIHWDAYAWQELSGAVADLAEGTERSFAHLISAKLHALINAATATVLHRLSAVEAEVEVLKGRVDPRIGKALQEAEAAVKTAKAAVASIEADAASIPGLVAGAESGAMQKIGSLHKSIGVAVAAATAVIKQRIKGIDETAKETLARVLQIAKTLTPAGVGGLVAAAVLAELHLGWLKCRGVNRVGRGLCGLSGVIETLALDIVDALVLTDLCWLIEEMATAAAVIAPVITDYGDGLNGLLKCRGISPPRAPKLAYSTVPKPWAALTFGASTP